MATGRVDPYLYFGGNCAEALNYYAEVFETAEPTVMKWKEMPGGSPDPALAEMVMHGNVVIDGSNLMMSDNPEGTKSGNSVALNYSSPDADRVRRVWDRFVSTGATATMPIEKTFFADLFGQLSDKFGMNWQIMQYEEPKPPA